MKQLFIGILVIAVLAVGGYYLYTSDIFGGDNLPQDTQTDDNLLTDEDQQQEETGPEEVIGASVEGRDIVAYHFGEGDTELLFVGGIHGGYSWNTALVAYEMIAYLQSTPGAVPSNVRVTVVPVLNPDGLHAVVGTTSAFAAADVDASETEQIAGRFNSNNVDLNRNFACDWQADATWQSRTVSGGDAAFSEPESKAIRDYVVAHDPEAVVVWYSAAGGVFASNCHQGVLQETAALVDVYADAADYTAYQDFDFYEVTGDLTNWLASERIPAISVLLTSHTTVEWSKNKRGIDAVLDYYAE